MSQATEKVFRELQKFLETNEPTSEEDFNQKVQEFQAKYNTSLKDQGLPTEDPNEIAYNLLDQTYEEESITKARKLARQAYKISPRCFDAIIFLAENAPNPTEAHRILEKGLLDEKRRLEKEDGYANDEYVGDYYMEFSSRPYIRGLCSKTRLLLKEGKMRQAATVGEEVIRLNNSDNLGMRYTLVAIYAFLEDEKSALKVLKKYGKDEFFIAFSMFILYYKLGNDKEAKKYFDRAKRANKYIVKLFNGKPPKKFFEDGSDYYSPGTESEIAVYLDSYMFLLITAPRLRDYVQKMECKNKNQNYNK